jgi:hypothetical protein
MKEVKDNRGVDAYSTRWHWCSLTVDIVVREKWPWCVQAYVRKKAALTADSSLRGVIKYASRFAHGHRAEPRNELLLYSVRTDLIADPAKPTPLRNV